MASSPAHYGRAESTTICLLTKLPRELRDSIYDCVLDNDQVSERQAGRLHIIFHDDIEKLLVYTGRPLCVTVYRREPLPRFLVIKDTSDRSVAGRGLLGTSLAIRREFIESVSRRALHCAAIDFHFSYWNPEEDWNQHVRYEFPTDVRRLYILCAIEALTYKDFVGGRLFRAVLYALAGCADVAEFVESIPARSVCE